MLTWGGLKAAPSKKGPKMNYIVLKSTVAAGSARKAGEIVELAPDEAANLLAIGRIAEAPKAEPKAAPKNRAAKPKSTRGKK